MRWNNIFSKENSSWVFNEAGELSHYPCTPISNSAAIAICNEYLSQIFQKLYQHRINDSSRAAIAASMQNLSLKDVQNIEESQEKNYDKYWKREIRKIQYRGIFPENIQKFVETFWSNPLHALTIITKAWPRLTLNNADEMMYFVYNPLTQSIELQKNPGFIKYPMQSVNFHTDEKEFQKIYQEYYGDIQHVEEFTSELYKRHNQEEYDQVDHAQTWQLQYAHTIAQFFLNFLNNQYNGNIKNLKDFVKLVDQGKFYDENNSFSKLFFINHNEELEKISLYLPPIGSLPHLLTPKYNTPLFKAFIDTPMDKKKQTGKYNDSIELGDSTHINFMMHVFDNLTHIENCFGYKFSSILKANYKNNHDQIYHECIRKLLIISANQSYKDYLSQDLTGDRTSINSYYNIFLYWDTMITHLPFILKTDYYTNLNNENNYFSKEFSSKQTNFRIFELYCYPIKNITTTVLDEKQNVSSLLLMNHDYTYYSKNHIRFTSLFQELTDILKYYNENFDTNEIGIIKNIITTISLQKYGKEIDKIEELLYCIVNALNEIDDIIYTLTEEKNHQSNFEKTYQYFSHTMVPKNLVKKFKETFYAYGNHCILLDESYHFSIYKLIQEGIIIPTIHSKNDQEIITWKWNDYHNLHMNKMNIFNSGMEVQDVSKVESNIIKHLESMYGLNYLFTFLSQWDTLDETLPVSWAMENLIQNNDAQHS